MNGIYIHIPFCRKSCHYCNFHFSTSLRLKDDLIDAIKTEIKLQSNFFDKEKIDTIYFGGGTPSVLKPSDFNKIWQTLDQNFDLSKIKEVTYECNPDDLNENYFKFLKESPVNRLSIGIQSFDKNDLKWMNRSHSAHQAIKALELAKKYEFDNITADLIFGIPSSNHTIFQKNIQTLLDFNIPHISTYALTVEEQTPLYHLIKKGAKKAPLDEHTIQQFDFLIDTLQENGFEHYEISNFAKEKKYSIHNTMYWQGAKYLGLGPGAHSYNGKNRFWNIAHNPKYIKSLAINKLENSTEILSKKDIYNEYVMVSLRTMWGCNHEKIKEMGAKFWVHFQENQKQLVLEKLIVVHNDISTLTKKGKFLADFVSSSLFI